MLTVTRTIGRIRVSDYGYAVEDGGIICPKCADNPVYLPSELERVDKEGYPDGYTCDDCWVVKR